MIIYFLMLIFFFLRLFSFFLRADIFAPRFRHAFIMIDADYDAADAMMIRRRYAALMMRCRRAYADAAPPLIYYDAYLLRPMLRRLLSLLLMPPRHDCLPEPPPMPRASR